MGKETLSGWVTLCVQQEIIFPRFIKGSKARKSTPLSAESQHSQISPIFASYMAFVYFVVDTRQVEGSASNIGPPHCWLLRMISSTHT